MIKNNQKHLKGCPCAHKIYCKMDGEKYSTVYIYITYKLWIWKYPFLWMLSISEWELIRQSIWSELLTACFTQGWWGVMNVVLTYEVKQKRGIINLLLKNTTRYSGQSNAYVHLLCSRFWSLQSGKLVEGSLFSWDSKSRLILQCEWRVLWWQEIWAYQMRRSSRIVSKLLASLSVFELVPPWEGLALVPEILGSWLVMDVWRGLIGNF